MNRSRPQRGSTINPSKMKRSSRRGHGQPKPPYYIRRADGCCGTDPDRDSGGLLLRLFEVEPPSRTACGCHTKSSRAASKHSREFKGRNGARCGVQFVNAPAVGPFCLKRGNWGQTGEFPIFELQNREFTRLSRISPCAPLLSLFVDRFANHPEEFVDWLRL